MSSRKVALTAAFLALAAGGTAACDNPGDEDVAGSTYEADPSGYQAGPAPVTSSPRTAAPSPSRTTAPRTTAPRTTTPVPAPPVAPVVAETEESGGEDTTDEVFYCADEEGEIVDEEYCADADETSSYFLWYSPSYPRGLTSGTYLDGGDYISAGDQEARRALKLPATGKVGNGTVKTGVVGRGSGGSGIGTGTSGG